LKHAAVATALVGHSSAVSCGLGATCAVHTGLAVGALTARTAATIIPAVQSVTAWDARLTLACQAGLAIGALTARATTTIVATDLTTAGGLTSAARAIGAGLALSAHSAHATASVITADLALAGGLAGRHSTLASVITALAVRAEATDPAATIVATQLPFTGGLTSSDTFARLAHEPFVTGRCHRPDTLGADLDATVCGAAPLSLHITWVRARGGAGARAGAVATSDRCLVGINRAGITAAGGSKGGKG